MWRIAGENATELPSALKRVVVVVAPALEVLEAHETLERDARLPAAIECVAGIDADEARGQRVAVEAVERLEAARLEAAVREIGDAVDRVVGLGMRPKRQKQQRSADRARTKGS